MGFSDYDNAWGNAGTGKRNDFMPPDGTYQVKIIDFSAFDSPKMPIVKFTMAPLFGEFQDIPFEHVHFIRNVRSLDFLKGDLQALGVELDRLSDIPAIAGLVVDALCEVTIKSKLGNNGMTFSNVYIQRRLNTEEESLADEYKENPSSYDSVTPLPSDPAEDDVPF